jgi:hypothetical protein
MGNIRNSLISFQGWIDKVKSARINNIITNLNRLKVNYVENCDLISALEQDLTRLREEDLSAVIKEIKVFDNLHNERPSPLFLNLIRHSNRDSLSVLKSEDGNAFVNDTERNDYIFNYFANVYRRNPEQDSVDYNNCINDFLGPDIVNHPVVQNSFLTDEERALLDRPLSMRELDEALNNCNFKSAAGQDGYSNKLIKNCWSFLRIPLFNYATHCFNTGILTHNFRSACMKLIPKKGDQSKLKN